MTANAIVRYPTGVNVAETTVENPDALRNDVERILGMLSDVGKEVADPKRDLAVARDKLAYAKDKLDENRPLPDATAFQYEYEKVTARLMDGPVTIESNVRDDTATLNIYYDDSEEPNGHGIEFPVIDLEVHTSSMQQGADMVRAVYDTLRPTISEIIRVQKRTALKSLANYKQL